MMMMNLAIVSLKTLSYNIDIAITQMIVCDLALMSHYIITHIRLTG